MKFYNNIIFLQQNSGASGSATSVDLGELPFDMPKLRRRLRVGGVNLILPSNISHNLTNNALNLSNNNSLSTDTSGVSQASSSQSVIQQDDRPIIGKFAILILINVFGVIVLMIMIMMMFQHTAVLMTFIYKK